ncbi:MAG: hypothetical protein QM733_20405 [Ilumatobacteraceae bacterium]
MRTFDHDALGGASHLCTAERSSWSGASCSSSAWRSSSSTPQLFVTRFGGGDIYFASTGDNHGAVAFSPGYTAYASQ